MNSQYNTLIGTLIIYLFCLISFNVQAQTNNAFWNPQMQQIAEPGSEPNSIVFSENSQLNPNTIFEAEKVAFGLTNEVCMELQEVKVEKAGLTCHVYQQYYKGIKVEGAMVAVFSNNNEAVKMEGEIIPATVLENAFCTMELEMVDARFWGCTMELDMIDARVGWLSLLELDLRKARELAIKNVGATKYLWEDDTEEMKLQETTNDPTASYFPKGDLVFKEVEGDVILLCYVFEIASLIPYGNARVYVNALNGDIVSLESLSELSVAKTNTTGILSPLLNPPVASRKIPVSASPNPFIAYTTFKFELNQNSAVEIILYDLLGNVKKVVAERAYFQSGIHEVIIEGDGLQSGMYICQIRANSKTGMVKLVYRNR